MRDAGLLFYCDICSNNFKFTARTFDILSWLFFYAVLSTILVALSPHLVSISSYILTETFFSFFLLASLSCITLAIQKKKAFLFILSSLLFGYTYLINETSFFIPFIIIALVFFRNLKKTRGDMNKKLLVNLIIFLSVYLLFPVGWTIRNNISLRPGSPTGSSRLISTLSHGAYPDFLYKKPEFKYFPYKEDPMQPEFGSSFHSFKKILWSRIKKHPFKYITWYLFKKPYWLWSWNILQGQGDIYIYPVIKSLYMSSYLANISRVIMKVIHPILLVLALTSLPLLFYTGQRKDNNESGVYQHILLFIICLYFTAIYTIAAPWPRYSVPLRPELYLCSIWSLQILYETYVRKKYSNNLLKTK